MRRAPNAIDAIAHKDSASPAFISAISNRRTKPETGTLTKPTHFPTIAARKTDAQYAKTTSASANAKYDLLPDRSTVSPAPRDGACATRDWYSCSRTRNHLASRGCRQSSELLRRALCDAGERCNTSTRPPWLSRKATLPFPAPEHCHDHNHDHDHGQDQREPRPLKKQNHKLPGNIKETAFCALSESLL